MVMQMIRPGFRIAALTLLLAGFAIRLLDVTDPPLDFHPSRQLFAYTNARGIYYALAPADAADAAIREKAIDAWQATDRYEPRILESIVAVLYLLLGGENFWIARILMSLIWAGGGWVLYQLARKLTGPGGGLFSLGYYLFLPFSIQASRSFQPDVLMVVGLICTAYLLLRWSEERSWKFSVFAGTMGGLTVLVKAQGIFAVSTMAVMVVWMTCGFRAPPSWIPKVAGHSRRWSGGSARSRIRRLRNMIPSRPFCSKPRRCGRVARSRRSHPR